MSETSSHAVYWTKLPVHTAIARARKLGAITQIKNLEHLVQDPERRHRMVMELFPDVESATPREELGVLFRLEAAVGRSAPYFLVQSNSAPEISEGGDIEVKKIAFPHLQPGDLVEFRLTVNAVRRHGNKVTVIPLDGAEGNGESPVVAWLQEKLAPGLRLTSINDHQREVLGVNRKGAIPGKRVVQIDKIDGVAEIVDPEQVYQWLGGGVGRAKAYGCGFLTVRKISSGDNSQ